VRLHRHEVGHLPLGALNQTRSNLASAVDTGGDRTADARQLGLRSGVGHGQMRTPLEHKNSRQISVIEHNLVRG
jgi:hypothetical protein